MPRASNGVYSLPAGNPVVTGTTIASTWANTSLSDIATAMTDSLDRSGFGGMLASLQLFAGTAGSPGLSWSVETNSGLYRNASGDFRYSIAATDILLISAGKFVVQSTPTIQSILGTYASGGYAGSFTNQLFELRTNNAARLSIAAGGTVTINAPSSAAYSLLITAGNSNNSCVAISGAAGVNASMEFAGNGTTIGATSLFIGQAVDSQSYVHQRANSTLNLGTNSLVRIVIAANGAVSVTPTSGIALTLNGVTGTNALLVLSPSTASGASDFQINRTTSTANSLANGPSIELLDSTAVTGTILQHAGGQSELWQFNGGWNQIYKVTTARGVVINAPASGAALQVTGVANANTLNITSSSTTGQAFGLSVNAGTNSSDYSLAVTNQTGGTAYLKVRGDGLTQAVDQGGTLQDVGWRGTPQNSQGTNYTCVLADRGKTIQATATINVTLPASVFSAGDVVTIAVGNGATVTVVQGAGLSMQWGGNGAATGNRTLTGPGICTMLYANPTAGIIVGTGLT